MANRCSCGASKQCENVRTGSTSRSVSDAHTFRGASLERTSCAASSAPPPPSSSSFSSSAWLGSLATTARRQSPTTNVKSAQMPTVPTMYQPQETPTHHVVVYRDLDRGQHRRGRAHQPIHVPGCDVGVHRNVVHTCSIGDGVHKDVNADAGVGMVRHVDASDTCQRKTYLVVALQRFVHPTRRLPFAQCQCVPLEPHASCRRDPHVAQEMTPVASEWLPSQQLWPSSSTRVVAATIGTGRCPPRRCHRRSCVKPAGSMWVCRAHAHRRLGSRSAKRAPVRTSRRPCPCREPRSAARTAAAASHDPQYRLSPPLPLPTMLLSASSLLDGKVGIKARRSRFASTVCSRSGSGGGVRPEKRTPMDGTDRAATTRRAVSVFLCAFLQASCRSTH
jgi:hypothetical protein